MATRKMSSSGEGVVRHDIEELLHLELIPGTEVMTDGTFSMSPLQAYKD
jgi:hypothetical protein